MGLETATTLAQLNPLWPLGTDPRSQGDDHLRLIKKVVQSDALSKAAGGTLTGPLTISEDQGTVNLGAGSGTWPHVYLVSNGVEIGATLSFARNNNNPADGWGLSMRPQSVGDYLELRWFNTAMFRFNSAGAASEALSVLNRGAADTRYVQGVRLSGFFTLTTTTANWNNAPAGGIINSLFMQTDARVSGARGMYLQQLIGGTWATVTGGY